MLPSVWQWSCHYQPLRRRSVATGDRTRSPSCEANALPLRHHSGKEGGSKTNWCRIFNMITIIFFFWSRDIRHGGRILVLLFFDNFNPFPGTLKHNSTQVCVWFVSFYCIK